MYLILIYGLFSVIWDVRNQMKAVDYRPEAAMWEQIGEQFDEADARHCPDAGLRLAPAILGLADSLHLALHRRCGLCQYTRRGIFL